jgi:hypothetical protein
MTIRSAPLSRIFSRDKAIHSGVLNRIGVQVARTVIARAVYNLRSAPTHPELAHESETLRRDGVVVIPSFLAPDLFEQVRDEAMTVLDQQAHHAIVHNVGPNRLEAIDVEKLAHLLPYTCRFYDQPRLKGLMENAERRKLHGYGFRGLERLTQGTNEGTHEGTHDAETELHSDIFYPVHKGWLYLTDVTLEHGPLSYVKGSHRVSPTQLLYVYRESCRLNAGSRRITEDEMERLGLEETPVVCASNTLVIANTLGYHRRLVGKSGKQRVALHQSLRSKPFTLR